MATLSGRPLTLHGITTAEFMIRLADLLYEIAIACGETKLDGLGDTTICVGATGLHSACESREIRRQAQETSLGGRSLLLLGDAEVAFVSHTQTLNGSVVIAHSGSASAVLHGGQTSRFGGWGPAAAEPGSGYRIGLGALRAVASEYDRREPRSLLWRCIAAWLSERKKDSYVPDWTRAATQWNDLIAELDSEGVDPRTAIFRFANSSARPSEFRSLVSGMVVPICEAAGQGSAEASDLVRRAAQELVRQHLEALSVAERRFDVPWRHLVEPLVVCGGALTHNSRLLERTLEDLREHIAPKMHLVTMDENTFPAEVGALLLALGHSGEDVLRLPNQDLLSRVVASCSGMSRPS